MGHLEILFQRIWNLLNDFLQGLSVCISFLIDYEDIYEVLGAHEKII